MEENQKNKSLVIKNDIEELNRLVSFLEEVEEEWMLPPGLIPSINLALEEALSNVIFYAFDKGSENDIHIHLSLEEKVITVVLTDHGRPYDPTQKEDPDITLAAEERPIGGLGIFLIKQIMDEVSYQRNDGTNQLTMKKHWN